jgi:iron(III) transport system substrate-binding protein
MMGESMKLRGVVVSLAMIAGVAGLAGCSAEDETLTIYSGRSENMIGPMFDQFSEETGINVEVRYGDSADLALQLQTEGENSPADVFVSQSPGAMGAVADDGLLTKLPADTQDLVVAEFQDPDGDWVGITGRVRTLVYNTELVGADELPDSVFDLTESEYRGKVGLAPSNGSFQDFVTAMRVAKGDDATKKWLDDMAANDAQPYADNTSIVQAVGRGEVPMGLVNHYYKEQATAENPDLPVENHFFPKGDVGSVLLATGAGILATSEAQDLGNELIEFLLSPAAQEFFTGVEFEYPSAKGTEIAEGTPLADVPATAVDFDELGSGFRDTLEMINSSGLASN